MVDNLIEIEKAREIVLAAASTLDAQSVDLHDALGRVLAESVRASVPVPAFDSSAMDGFALRAEDVEDASPHSPALLRVVGESRAGKPAEVSLSDGEAIAISTGAMIPAGADAVVRVEDTDAQRGEPNHGERSEAAVVRVFSAVSPRQDVRFAGDDLSSGQEILDAGARLGPVELGVLASVGHSLPRCVRRPLVSVITTGDELVEPSQPLRQGAIHNSSSLSIPALVTRAGADLKAVAHAIDDPQVTTQTISDALEGDVVVICGGVSVGVHDHVRDSLAALGVEKRFAGVALRPGKPMWFGTRGDTLVFALPGNPVSALVTFVLFAGPAIRALGGLPAQPLRMTARLGCDYGKQRGRAEAVRCTLHNDGEGWRAEPTGPQASHLLTSMLSADALAILPRDSDLVRAGETVVVEMLGPWLAWRG